ncbi:MULTISPECIES: DUF4434 domain-containing protein [unclassified Photobacterium]|uniref:DUF4434 domain-containing protein n=1 Tax=unclassified Photobacterium TaxID=2628852 RepID=UPI000D161463|nr:MULTISPECIES: DUF4434 domain-containing protein [unclassified Photobacterium]PSV35730.1 hypothetical protein C9J44_11965 [Photobacterium sp. GB-27]PSV37282.1 hypothetical protein C9J38_10970 [Photobacterium sp. GB-210]PSV43094.1 hypothetical protein C9J46_13175 [Photobacterium sp. GB-36]PSV52104.1 hypothetical protein C9J45_13155 [Photobacterium sp. GB-1]PSV56513.1 hypothetical protein C9J43_10505 [Photobacterium sp. GB-3]
MATYSRKFTTQQIRRCCISTVFLFLLIGCQNTAQKNDLSIFYQPLNQDYDISIKQWQHFGTEIKKLGVQNVVIQWTQYGNETFGESHGWLAKRMEVLQDNNIKLWVGLYSDPNYFRQIHTDQTAQKVYLKQYFDKLHESYLQWRVWLKVYANKVQGLYLPLELSDYDFKTPAQREQLAEILAQQVKLYDQPLMISLYLSGELPQKQIKLWTEQLTNLGLIVYVQNGAGTQALSADERHAYLNDLDCNVGIIREIFVQDKAYKSFKADRISKGKLDGILNEKTCHPDAMFSLRYLPINSNPLKLVGEK